MLLHSDPDTRQSQSSFAALSTTRTNSATSHLPISSQAASSAFSSQITTRHEMTTTTKLIPEEHQKKKSRPFASLDASDIKQRFNLGAANIRFTKSHQNNEDPNILKSKSNTTPITRRTTQFDDMLSDGGFTGSHLNKLEKEKEHFAGATMSSVYTTEKEILGNDDDLNTEASEMSENNDSPSMSSKQVIY